MVGQERVTRQPQAETVRQSRHEFQETPEVGVSKDPSPFNAPVDHVMPSPLHVESGRSCHPEIHSPGRGEPSTPMSYV